MDKRLKVLVICHKMDDNTRTQSPYFPIQVGAELHPELDLGFQKDNVGDNISSRNANWCELTGIYWGWKNIKDVDYIGVCHYRRYFDIKMDVDSISHYLNKCDIIVADGGKMVDRSSRARNLMWMTSQEDTYLFIDTLLSMYPKFKDSIYKYFYDSRFSYPFTMFITRKELYDDYCNFIFPVLFTVEKKLKNHDYTRLKRTIGYFGEWSLGLYVLCMKKKACPVPVVQLGVIGGNCSKLKQYVKCLRNKFLSLAISSLNPIPPKIIVPEAVKVGLKADGIELEVL